MKRLPPPYGLLIDREQPINFSFEKNPFRVLPATVLPALWRPTTSGC